EDDFARDLLAAECLEFVEVFDDDHIGGDPFGRRGDAAAERRQHDLLSRIRGLPLEFDERPGFRAAHPVWHHDPFKLHFQTEPAQFGGNILDGLLCLRRTAQPRADVVAQVRGLSVSVIALERGALQMVQFSRELIGEADCRRRLSPLRRAGKSEGQNCEDSQTGDRKEAIVFHLDRFSYFASCFQKPSVDSETLWPGASSPASRARSSAPGYPAPARRRLCRSRRRAIRPALCSGGTLRRTSGCFRPGRRCRRRCEKETSAESWPSPVF